MTGYFRIPAFVESYLIEIKQSATPVSIISFNSNTNLTQLLILFQCENMAFHSNEFSIKYEQKSDTVQWLIIFIHTTICNMTKKKKNQSCFVKKNNKECIYDLLSYFYLFEVRFWN